MKDIKDINITIFIHGTLMPHFALLNPYKVYKGTIGENDRYIKSLSKLRNNPLIYRDSIILQEGIEKIPNNLLLLWQSENLPDELLSKGAYQAIAAYHYLDSKINKDIYNNRYYTFGYKGILSDKHRREASRELYCCINSIVQKYRDKGFNPIINICAYSHGGNVALHMASYSKSIKSNFNINKLILLATPIQQETFYALKSSIFKEIINIYSESDIIQPGDKISVNGRSYQTFKDIFNLNNESIYKYNIKDIRFLIDGKSYIGHYEFWIFNQYNKSFMYNTKQELIKSLIDPMPIVILLPMFFNVLTFLKRKIFNYYNLDISLNINENGCLTVDLFENNKLIKRIEDNDKIVEYIKNRLIKNWAYNIELNNKAKEGLEIFSIIRSLF